MSQENRVETMAVKLAEYTRRAGVDPEPLVRAYHMAVQLRLRALGDAFHPDLLHPARTALILVEDTGCTDPSVLAAAALTETEFPELRLPQSEIQVAFDQLVVDLAAAIPHPGEADEMLLEELLTAPRDVGLIALAERLDHARHLHFRDAAIWRPFFEQITAVYLPFSERISEPLTLRFSRWSNAFERRFPQPT